MSQEDVIDWLATHDEVTIKDIMHKYGITRASANRNLLRMEKNGEIELLYTRPTGEKVYGLRAQYVTSER